MRFLMLNWRDPRNPLAGGAERVTLAYLKALVERGHEACWFANDFPGATREEMVEGVKIVRGGGMGSSVVKARQWYRQQKRFDLVIDQHHGIPWYAPWWCRTNCVAYIHEVLGPIWTSFYPWPVSTVGRWQERWTHWLYRRVPFWTACQATRDCLTEHGVQSIKMIPYGVDTVALPSLDEKPLTLPLRLVVVSRLAPNKRIDHAVRVMKCLADKNVPAHLTVVGTGETEGLLRGLVKEFHLGERVSFAGALTEKEKDEQLRRAHFLVHTSLREGWGLNVIEANAMGTTTVVYPVAGLVESTLHDETGIVAAAETPEAVAEALVSILSRPEKYEEYRVKAWERAKTFHWSRVLAASSAWLEAAAAGKIPK
jgi:glycosyltransferase involved in cell wall biosynthesis